MNNWQPVDCVVGVLVVTVCCAMALAGYKVMRPNDPMNEFRLEVYQGVFMAVMSVISLYVGAKLQSTADKREK